LFKVIKKYSPNANLPLIQTGKTWTTNVDSYSTLENQILEYEDYIIIKFEDYIMKQETIFKD